ALAAARKTGRDWLFAALSTDSVMRLAEVSAQKPVGSRGAFSGNLEALAEWLRDLMAVAAGAEEEVADPDARQWLSRVIARKPLHPIGIARSIERVTEAQFWAQGNVNPQLILADLLRHMHADLRL